jgi:hypothetical protein
VRGAVTTLVLVAGALTTGLGATGAGVGAAGGVTIVVIVPFTDCFCFVDDVVFGGRADHPAGYRLRIKGNC